MDGKGKDASGLLYTSAFVRDAKVAEPLDFSAADGGQNCPRHCPPLGDAHEEQSGSLLGEPLTIQEVARIFGCSAWTVRQRLLPQGLPHFRLSPAGKLLFFRNQIVRWVLEKQRAGSRMAPVTLASRVLPRGR